MTVRSGLTGLLVGAAIGLACTSASAQGDGLPVDRSELFAYLVRNPGDVRATLRYADLSKDAGDIEAAIGALERILFYEPNEPNTRLYLGLLYAKLGSYDMARGYFESVMGHPGTPEAIRQRAAYLMEQADQRTNPHQWNGFVRTGLRWQSNANYEATSGGFWAYDPDFPAYYVTEGDPKSDWNAYVQGGVFYTYDFGNQRGDRFEAGVTTYNTRQFDFDEFNFNHVEATVGVRFGIPTDNPTAMASVKPYLIAAGAALDDEELYWNGGGGVQVSVPVGASTVSGYAQAVWREYDEDAGNFIPDIQEFSGQTGWVYSAGLRFASDTKAASRVQAHIGYERREVDDPETFETEGAVEFGSACFPCGTFTSDYQSYDRVSAELRLPFDLYVKGHHILTTPLVGVRWTKYDEVDPFTVDELDDDGDPVFEVREDWEARFGVSIDYAINDMAGIGVALLYTTTSSNLSAYDTDNMSVSFGPHFRF